MNRQQEIESELANISRSIAGLRNKVDSLKTELRLITKPNRGRGLRNSQIISNAITKASEIAAARGSRDSLSDG